MTSSDQQPAPVRLRPPRHRVQRRAIAWWTTRALLLAISLIGGLVIASVLAVDERAWLVPLSAVVAALSVGYVLVMPQWRYRVHRWETTADAVYTSAGWLRQEWRVAPMSRIQTVDSVRGPLQRLFDLASVTVTTASAAGPLTIDGLDRATAADVVQHLTATTQATPGDAT